MGDMDEDSNSYCVSDEDESEDAFEVVCMFFLYFILLFYFILLKHLNNALTKVFLTLPSRSPIKREN